MTRRELSFVAPLVVAFTIDGVEVEVSPAVVRDLPRLIRLAAPMFDEVALLPDGLFDRLADGARDPQDLVELGELIGRRGETLIDLVALLSGQPAEWVGSLLLDRAAELLAICVEVNADFFKRAAPNLASIAARMGQGEADPTTAGQPEPLAGQTPSPN
jgi:hypothetical protein